MVRGETKISKSRRPIQLVRLKPANCDPLPETIEAIQQADLITLGPGSLYTSVIPNILVKGMAGGDPQFSGHEGLFCELDVAARRNDQFFRLRRMCRRSMRMPGGS